MGSRGPRPKPIEQKRRTGNPGKRALPAANQLAAVPVIPPASYERSVEQALDDVLAIGVPWLAATDAPLVSMLREAVEHYAEARDDPRSTPKELLDARAQLMRLMAELGFSPASRAELGLAEVKAQSTLEKLRASRR
jgi:hypothetical protein